MRKRVGNKDQAILQAAVKVFAEHGYHRAKISTIAELAGVATGSIYLYYENKESILLAIFDKLWLELTANLQEIVKRTDIDAIHKLDMVIDQYFGMFIANSSLALVYVSEQPHLINDRRGNVAQYFEHFLDVAEEIVRQGVAQQLFSPNIEIKMYRHYLIGGFRSLLQLWAEQSQAFSLDRICENVKYYSKYGLLIHQEKA